MFVLRANLEPEDEDEELRVGTRVGLRWFRKITSLDQVGTLLTPLLQLRRPHRTVLVAVRRSSAQSVREEGEERMRDRERAAAEG